MKRTALVTGGNRGIGLEICRQLGERGLRVVLTARDEAAGREAAERLSGGGGEILFEVLDVADAQAVDACARRLHDRGVDIDVLVNNAGVMPEEGFSELTSSTLEKTLGTNALGPAWTAMAFSPGMVERAYGRIVNVSSGWGSFAEGLEGPPAYSISKAALNAVTVKLAQALPDTVKANACCPGWVRTRMGGEQATRSVEEGADTPVWLATLPDDGPTGGFFRRRRPIEW